MKIKLWILLVLTGIFSLTAQKTEEVEIKRENVVLSGTLAYPVEKTKTAVLLIAGSGPTDRNGNAPGMTNNCLRILSDSLTKHGLAVLRYDKRGIGKSRTEHLTESDLRFEDFVTDAVAWIKFLRAKGFEKIIVAGHSQGSLVGILAAQQVPVDGFISLEGAGYPLGTVLKKQFSQSVKIIRKTVDSLIDILQANKKIDSVPPLLAGLFRQSVQEFLKSWMKYDPAAELAKLHIPVLIVAGTTDLQISLDDARKLLKAKPDARLEIIEGMNHILKDAPIDREKNIATYNRPDLPVSRRLISVMTDFIAKIQEKNLKNGG